MLRLKFCITLSLVICFCTHSCDQVLAQRGQRGPSRVVTANAIETSLAGSQSFVGTLEANRKAIIGSAVEGRVTEVMFNAGDPVGSISDSQSPEFRGQPLVQLLTSTIDIEIRAAEIQAELAAQSFDELKLTMPQTIALAKANLAELESRLEYSKTRYQRSRNLQQQSGAISQLELDEARSEYEANRQSVLGSRVEVRRLESTSELKLAQAKSRHDSAMQELLRLRDLQSQYTIRAPFEGVVTQQMTEVGAWVGRGAAVAEIVQLDPIEMIVNVPQEYSGQLQQSLLQATESGSPLAASININGIATQFKGEVIRIIPQADLRSRSFPVRIRIANPRTEGIFALQSGMLGRATMLIGRQQEMVLVKKDALVLGQSGTTIYKTGKDGEKTVAVPVSVTTGTEFGDWIQVVGQVNGNDQVIVLGNERLRPGSEIEITEARTEALE